MRNSTENTIYDVNWKIEPDEKGFALIQYADLKVTFFYIIIMHLRLKGYDRLEVAQKTSRSFRQVTKELELNIDRNRKLHDQNIDHAKLLAKLVRHELLTRLAIEGLLGNIYANRQFTKNGSQDIFECFLEEMQMNLQEILNSRVKNVTPNEKMDEVIDWDGKKWNVSTNT